MVQEGGRARVLARQVQNARQAGEEGKETGTEPGGGRGRERRKEGGWEV